MKINFCDLPYICFIEALAQVATSHFVFESSLIHLREHVIRYIYAIDFPILFTREVGGCFSMLIYFSNIDQ